MKSIVLSFCTMSCLMFTSFSSYAAYDMVSCETENVFSENSCSQCFHGGSVHVGDNKWLLSDTWQNADTRDQIMFKEEQDMPQMMPLSGATWTELKASDSIDFWQYTETLENLYDEDNLGYLLPTGESVMWIESSLGSAYQLSSSSVDAGTPIGLLMYDLAVHNVENDEVELDATSQRSCVKFDAAWPHDGSMNTGAEQMLSQTPEQLPDTGAEHVLLIVVALMLGFGFLKFRARK